MYNELKQPQILIRRTETGGIDFEVFKGEATEEELASFLVDSLQVRVNDISAALPLKLAQQGYGHAGVVFLLLCLQASGLSNETASAAVEPLTADLYNDTPVSDDQEPEPFINPFQVFAGFEEGQTQ